MTEEEMDEARIAIADPTAQKRIAELEAEYGKVLVDRNKLLGEFQAVRVERDRLREENARLHIANEQDTQTLLLSFHLHHFLLRRLRNCVESGPFFGKR